ncbi:uncharacterized protein PHALS_10585 [Plasmopara halstedii]|uniref:Uncharacterized protein n=1 Tax=Plasmopara halstedii TaxID=4781 RepID=A0A0P1AGR0_PLAHL|nr:uncharacterized protein PHALS_10585 [Plasmopara halstedii]CEG40381.1 hypothetical protein PHALS_10585 [Plasmopara halstedii]|eukprot:XP_024576750.1 hypothetical protein PHALS_10585 [Plasmopara halstedii]
MKALAIVAQILCPTYQSMIRAAASAYDAWETLRSLFAKQSLRNREQLRNELHGILLGTGGELMKLIVQSDDLEYDATIRIIETHEMVILLDVKEMLRREFRLAKVVEVVVEEVTDDDVGVEVAVVIVEAPMAAEDSTRRRIVTIVRGYCFNCNEDDHKRDEYTEKLGNLFAFLSTMDASAREVSWLLNSGARSHMTGKKIDFVEYKELKMLVIITVAISQQLLA